MCSTYAETGDFTPMTVDKKVSCPASEPKNEWPTLRMVQTALCRSSLNAITLLCERVRGIVSKFEAYESGFKLKICATRVTLNS